ncbi:HTH domain-containing protein [Methylotuvimicrobium buryatense]|nr:HTH domain-containing protein [Methylotuvimicrobium buryatense]
MDTIAEIRRLHFVENIKISELAKRFKLSRPTIRKHLKTIETPVYSSRKEQPQPKLGDYLNQLNGWLEKDTGLPRKQRRNAQRLFECLQIEGYCGTYTAVQRHVRDWKRTRTKSPTIKQAFVPLAFPPKKLVSSTGVMKRR